jgi:hypothetical protein
LVGWGYYVHCRNDNEFDRGDVASHSLQTCRKSSETLVYRSEIAPVGLLAGLLRGRKKRPYATLREDTHTHTHTTKKKLQKREKKRRMASPGEGGGRTQTWHLSRSQFSSASPAFAGSGYLRSITARIPRCSEGSERASHLMTLFLTCLETDRRRGKETPKLVRAPPCVTLYL